MVEFVEHCLFEWERLTFLFHLSYHASSLVVIMLRHLPFLQNNLIYTSRTDVINKYHQLYEIL